MQEARGQTGQCSNKAPGAFIKSFTVELSHYHTGGAELEA